MQVLARPATPAAADAVLHRPFARLEHGLPRLRSQALPLLRREQGIDRVADESRLRHPISRAFDASARSCSRVMTTCLRTMRSTMRCGSYQCMNGFFPVITPQYTHSHPGRRTVR